MPEIKHTFTGGKMNLDLDERFVPNGQYREALNIQVRTSDDGDAGTVTNIQGNSAVTSVYNLPYPEQNYAPCVGSCFNETTNKAYFFFAGPNIDGQGPGSWIIPIDPIAFYSWSNRIIEYDAITNHYSTVVNDVYALTSKVSGMINLPINPTLGYDSITVSEDIANERIRPGCSFQLWGPGNVPLFDTPPKVIGVANNTLFFDSEYTDELTGATRAAFWWPEVLEFHKDRLITGVNIVDDFLFWTDGSTEPKKINIKRCKAGTEDDDSWSQTGYGIPAKYHTKLMVENGLNQLVAINDLETTTDEYLKREHITVLRPAPRKAPRLEMARTTRSNEIEGTIVNQAFSENGTVFESGAVVSNVTIDPEMIGFIVGDYVILRNTASDEDPKEIRAEILADNNDGTWDLQVDNVPTNVLDSDTGWSVVLEQKKPLFELTLGRFAYRYKYVDSEYSAISPWSELAFLPDEFEYEPKTGHNLGMLNTVRDLKITDFVGNDLTRPDDVSEVDILYKESRNATCYVVKTIKRDIDPEWDVQTNVVTGTKGAIQITSELIHRALPSDQTLRAWDAVPRYATAQTLCGGRLMYGNYTQNYNVPRFTLKQSLFSNPLSSGGNSALLPEKSIKSLRKYKVGVVFGDQYGRETPVQEASAQARYIPSTESYEFIPPELNVEKPESRSANKLVLQQDWTTPQGQSILPPDWMKYYKYYVKEVSSEYYNLPMDRWYDAEDGNVWLSFYSHDRNKIDEETYIILKSQHGSQIPVEQEARYKVLAIQNEAPDFIKADGWVLGSIPLNFYADSDTEDLFVNATTLSVDTGDYNTDIADIEQSSLGVRYVRAIAQTASFIHRSRWVRVVNVSGLDTVNANINLGEVLGPSADFMEIWEANSYDEPLLLTSYQLEFKEEEISNKPEFEGRFFVKIYRDDALESNVLNETSAQDAFWATLDSFGFTYLAFGHGGDGFAAWDFDNNNSPNPGLNGSADNQPYANYIIGDTSIINPNPHYTAFISGDCGFQVFSDYNLDEPHLETDHINNFGNCVAATATRAFWINWSDHKACTWFIDQTTFSPRSYGNMTSSWAQWHQNEDDHAYASKGLHSSGDTGDKDMLFFGCKGAYSELGTADKDFADTMQSVGTYFTFAGDPNEIKYRVIGSSGTKEVQAYQVEPGFFEDTFNFYTGNWAELFSNCNPCDQSWSSCRRSTFWIKFRRVSEATGNLTPLGLDASLWDPRSVVTHDGQVKSTIKIVTPFVQQGNLVTTLKDNAVWETEPKENVDIDLYYEASNALPLRLDSNNIVDYAPQGSFVNSVRRLTGGFAFGDGTNTHNLETVTLYPKAVVSDHIQGAVEFKEWNASAESAIVDYKSLLIGDELTLLHPDGVETNLVIRDYLETQDPVGTLDLAPIPTSSITFPLNFTPSSEGGDSLVLKDQNLGSVASPQYLAIDWIVERMNQFPKQRVLIESSDYNFLGIQSSTYVRTTQGPQQYADVDDVTGEIRLTSGLIIGNTVGPLQPAFPITANVTLRAVGPLYQVEEKVYDTPVKLAWHNCYSFGNGVESNRIRDDFNANYIDNGGKASTVLEEYGEETRANGIIYSGLYNDISGLNALNEFNTAVQITKNLNPVYGSIQALRTRDTNVLAFCEDKVVKILANKDAVFNADGNMNLTATNRVLGQSIPFMGDYGISKNPESLAEDQFRYYFTDKQRGAVLRLSGDGLTPISEVGMRQFFRKNLRYSSNLIGTFDGVNGEYNLSLLQDHKMTYRFEDQGQERILNAFATAKYWRGQTVTFNEASKGWVSFKSFLPSAGGTVAGKYVTTGNKGVDKDSIWLHYSDEIYGNTTMYNSFYGLQFDSFIDVIFNDNPSEVKTFMALNYEGTDQYIPKFDYEYVSDAAGNNLGAVSDGRYDNLVTHGASAPLGAFTKQGWYVDDITTDLQTGSLTDFIKKENKYFGYIRGSEGSGWKNSMWGATSSTFFPDKDLEEFSVQGIGIATAVTDENGDPYTQSSFTFTIR